MRKLEENGGSAIKSHLLVHKSSINSSSIILLNLLCREQDLQLGQRNEGISSDASYVLIPIPPQETSHYHLQNVLIQDEIIKLKKKCNLALKKAKTQATLHRKHRLHSGAEGQTALGRNAPSSCGAARTATVPSLAAQAAG